jgi:hypothetical protein
MKITTEYTVEDIQKITQALTKEAKEQVRLYHLSDCAGFVIDGMARSTERYVVRDADDYPIACAGVTRNRVFDTMFLVVTTHAIADYRAFCRLVEGWLGMRTQSLVVGIPEASTATLRMVERWGFKRVAVVPHANFNLIMLVHEKEP